MDGCKHRSEQVPGSMMLLVFDLTADSRQCKGQCESLIGSKIPYYM